MIYTKDNRPASPQGQPVRKESHINCIQSSLVLAGDWNLMPDGFACSFSIKNARLSCKWIPNMPSKKKLRRITESDKYIAARHKFLSSIADRIGGTIFLVEVKP